MTEQRGRLTDKQIAFVTALHAGHSQTKAYRLAGYAGDDGNASRLALNPNVRAELQRLQDQRLSVQELTLPWWREAVADYYRASVEAGDLSNRGRALELAGRHLGALDPQTPQSQAAAQILARLFAQALDQRALPQQQPTDITASVTMTDSSGRD